MQKINGVKVNLDVAYATHPIVASHSHEPYQDDELLLDQVKADLRNKVKDGINSLVVCLIVF